MYKLTFLTAGLLLAAAAVAPQAWGQALPLGADTAAGPAALPSLSTLRYDRTDTLRALQHLFMQRSKAMRSWLETGTAIMATGAVKKTMVATSSKKKRCDNESYYENLDGDANGDLLIGGLMAGYGAYRYTRFGPRQYQRVVAAYQEGQPLPSYLKRKLKTKYFRLLPIGSRKERAEAVGQ